MLHFSVYPLVNYCILSFLLQECTDRKDLICNNDFLSCLMAFTQRVRYFSAKETETSETRSHGTYRQLGLNEQLSLLILLVNIQTKKKKIHSSRWLLQSPQPEKQAAGCQRHIFTGSNLLQCLFFLKPQPFSPPICTDQEQGLMEDGSKRQAWQVWHLLENFAVWSPKLLLLIKIKNLAIKFFP